ncbi:shikimate dehydrogenase [Acidaminobacter sp. JC074]|uniref:shikimate dehydrogenase n=1 Tax=Acidaminobacter sp. JC074 TaxID=2530199 RepID=UPI001F0EB489|nr:shikimate dehydrogenase [Acidaminobacter sp. JC074]MCH4888795.1 shikimate dehydrogenase [Acidaminobacter sp. JC074]
MINGKTKTVCLLGSPVEHSFSPMMHNASFQKLGINAKYLAFDVHPSSIEQAVEGVRAFGFLGCNVTIPHKEAVMQHLDEIDPKAERIGAVNTVVNENGRLKGYNTDVDGFIESFKTFHYDFKNKKIAVLGTGGASKAVVVGLLYQGVGEIHIFSRSYDKSSSFCDRIDNSLKAMTYDQLDETFPYDVVVNTTPVGMHPNEGKSVIHVENLGHKETIFYDLIYNPLETEFLRQGRESGRRTLNGLDMLIYQGIYALRYWVDFDHSKWTRDDVIEVLKASHII